MILAAGLGTRLRPLTDLRAKPALPVQGRPVISLLLELLARQGFEQVMINLHHLPQTIRDAVGGDRPAGIEIAWSEEPEPLGTGGGIRRAADFLREDEACVVLAGDMLLDFDLAGLLARHVESGRSATLLLREDPRVEDFGTIGLDARARVIRIGRNRLDLRAAPSETARGLFTGVRCFSRAALDGWPAESVFEDLRDWLSPGIESGDLEVGAEIAAAEDSVWEPVGTPAEYLDANLSPPVLQRLGGAAERWRGEVDLRGARGDVIVSRKAFVPDDVVLERAVVWDGESVPAGFQGADGVWAGGRFRVCRETVPGSVH